MGSIRLVLDGPIAGAEVPALCERLRTMLADVPGSRVDCELGSRISVDLGTVEALAMLQLTATRRGSSVVLRRAPSGMAELVALVGLTRMLRFGVEVVRQPEHREEAGGVQEEGDPADPIA